MPHLVVELILWILLIFFIGCILGNLLRQLFASGEAEALAERPPPEPVVEKASAPVVKQGVPAVEATVAPHPPA